MDMRVFYQKIRALESTIPDLYVVVISLETPEGGKAGMPTEVRRDLAAKLVVEGRARLATPEETNAFRNQYRQHSRKGQQ